MPLNKHFSKLKIKIFQRVREQYAIIGISPSNQSNQKFPFSKRVFLGFLSFSCTTVSQFVYILYVANDFMECMECVCSLSGTIILFVCFAAIVFRKAKLFDSIDNIEKLIDSSKSAFKLIIVDFINGRFIHSFQGQN